MRTILFLSFACFLFTACNQGANQNANPAEGPIYSILNPTDFATKIKTGGQLIDVRTPEEMSQGAISGAILIDYNADGFETKIKTLKKDQPVLLYCRSGGRSGKTAQMLQKLGYSEIYDLEGGFMAWSKAFPSK